MCAQGMELRIRLSERMQTIADHVEPGETAADIGTDHGQIPIWLFAKGICPSVILTDISAESLAKAKETAGAYQFSGAVSFRVGDGISVLKPAEADAVIIAGMGGKLIRDIMAADPEHTNTFRKFILQPRKGSGALRKWLLLNGFLFAAEDIVREGRFLPEIITATRPDPYVADLAQHDRTFLQDLPEDDIRLRVPPWTLQAGGPVKDYLDLRLGQERLVLDNMRRAKQRDGAAEDRILQNIHYLEAMRSEINEI